MVRLIVEEGGERRAFRLGEGVLTVGSGAAARLRLASPDVAEVHAEVDLRGGRAHLRPRAGVLPPTIAGAPVQGEVPLDLGIAVRVGSATLWLQDDEGPIQTPLGLAPAAVASPVPAAGGAGRGRAVVVPDAERAVRREAAVRAAKQGARRSVVQATRPRVQRGMPTWAILLVVLLVVGLAFVFGRQALRSSAKASVNVDGVLLVAEQLVADSNFDSALLRIESIPASVELTNSQRERVAAIRRQVAERGSRAELDRHNNRGTEWMDVYLKRYETRWLQGAPEPAKVRVFLERCREFRRRWPLHPELDWVERHEGRLAGLADLSAPPTWEDIDWKVWLITESAPRNYREAFALLDEYVQRPGASEVEAAQALRAKLVEARAEYHRDRLLQAEYEYEKEQTAKAVWWLVHSVIWLGDPDMENEAAQYLVKMPDLVEHLRGYEDKYPEKYEALLRNPVVAAYAREAGL